ncbi:hypothetical protein D3C80_1878920 [compost metagenome]
MLLSLPVYLNEIGEDQVGETRALLIYLIQDSQSLLIPGGQISSQCLRNPPHPGFQLQLFPWLPHRLSDKAFYIKSVISSLQYPAEAPQKSFIVHSL